MLSLQGFAPIWGFSMIIYKTFAKDFSQIGANLFPGTLKNGWKQTLKEKTIVFKKVLRILLALDHIQLIKLYLYSLLSTLKAIKVIRIIF